MYKKWILLSLLAATSLPANDEPETLKQQLQKQQQTIQLLMQKVDKLEKAKAQEEQRRINKTAMQSNRNSFSQSSFVPDMSLIVDTSYVSRNKKDEALKHLEIPDIAHGIMGEHSHGGGHTHAPVNAHDGFNLNYAEVAMQSAVDPWFSLTGIFHLSENSFEIEEAYAETTSLGYGLKAKIGKFRSAFGRINEQHRHVQDFSDMPLVYVSFLGGHGINDIGAQLQWTLPTDSYIMAGFEALQGKNPSMYGTDAIVPEGDEEVVAVKSPSQPNLLTGYIKSSFDLENTTFLYGASVAHGKSRLNHLSHEDPHAFVGSSYLYGVDVTLKHYFDSYSYLTFQGEYLYRDMDGDVYRYTDASKTAFTHLPVTKKQGGYYAQLIYAYNRNWRVGVRYDNIDKNEITVNGTAKDTKENFNRYTAMIDYTLSEFSRIRLQYNHNRAMFNEEGERQNIKTIVLQVNMAIGSHGAHNF